MTALGWTFMIVSMGTVLTMVSYCIYKVLSLPPMEAEESLHGQPQIDTHDLHDED